jgi:hypothetical protein
MVRTLCPNAYLEESPFDAPIRYVDRTGFSERPQNLWAGSHLGARTRCVPESQCCSNSGCCRATIGGVYWRDYIWNSSVAVRAGAHVTHMPRACLSSFREVTRGPGPSDRSRSLVHPSLGPPFAIVQSGGILLSQFAAAILV